MLMKYSWRMFHVLDMFLSVRKKKVFFLVDYGAKIKLVYRAMVILKRTWNFDWKKKFVTKNEEILQLLITPVFCALLTGAEVCNKSFLFLTKFSNEEKKGKKFQQTPCYSIHINIHGSYMFGVCKWILTLL